MSQHPRSRIHSLLSILQAVLQPDALRLLLNLAEFLAPLLSKPPITGMYEVLEHESQLELLDVDGREATYVKRQQVRFLQDNVIAYQDIAWGDGDIFAHYQCSPGIAVDRYKEGHLYHILISLRKTMNRGDVQAFHIRRHIRNGFIKDTDDFQVEVNHRIRKLTVKIIFAAGRIPKQCWLIERNARRTRALGTEHFTVLPDQRLEVTWHTEEPKAFEAYLLRWQW